MGKITTVGSLNTAIHFICLWVLWVCPVGQRVVYATFTLPIMQFALPTCENVKCVCVFWPKSLQKRGCLRQRIGPKGRKELLRELPFLTLTMPSHGVNALAFILLSYSLYSISQKIYKLPWQPCISTLIDMCWFHSSGRKSTYRALIGGFKWWKTGVFWSVFPENSYNENSSVNLLGFCCFYQLFMIAQSTG